MDHLTTKNTITMADKKIKPVDNVTVYGTGKSAHMKDGVAYEVHSNLAEQLIASGKATSEPSKGKKAEKV